MDYAQAFAISAAGMNVERARVDVAAVNLANANTVVARDGTGFQPMRVVARTVGIDGNLRHDGFGALFGEGMEAYALLGAMPEIALEPLGSTPRRVLEPGHPMADEKGFVTYPGVDPATEMMTLMTAMRAYEANVAAMNAARTMAVKALDIGGGSSS